jgi:FKBP-type peptidyl-prolyl cis-trans isomerase
MMYKAKNFSARFTFLILFIFLAGSLLFSCKKGESHPDALDSDTSYAIGMLMANELSGMGLGGLIFDYEAFVSGFKDYNEDEETRLSIERAMELINAVFMQLHAQNDDRMWLEAEKNREEGEAFMAENRARSGVLSTPSGLQYEVISQGSGRRPGPDDTVRVHYEGTLIDGTVFDSSYRRGQPLEFHLGMVIAGWTEGLQLMNEGSTYRFVIPPDLAYGPGGAGPIPPNSTLVFRVELISIVD